MTLVAYEKQPMPLCMALCKIARERGLSDLGIWDHTVSPKMREVSWTLFEVGLFCFKKNCACGKSSYLSLISPGCE